MKLQEQITADMRQSMKANNPELVSGLRVIVGEMQRSVNQPLSDDEAVKLLRKLVKSEQELLEKTGKQTSKFMEIVSKYLPQMATEEEIKVWITQNVDFSKLKNKMMAMKDILAHFGAQADGNVVKNILMAE